MGRKPDAPAPAPTTAGQPGLSYVRAVDSVELSTETVGQCLARLARNASDHPALVWLTERGTDSMTRGELHSRSCDTAARLCELNPHGGRVALAAPNSVYDSDLDDAPFGREQRHRHPVRPD